MDYTNIAGAWEDACRTGDYSKIDKISTSDLRHVANNWQSYFFNPSLLRNLNAYLMKRDSQDREIAIENTRQRAEWRKWIVASVAVPVVIFTVQFLYFNETSSRPFITFRYINEVNIMHDNHIELDSTGKPYEDKTRKDIMLRIEIKSTGGMPANITCTDIYLDYKGHPRQRIIRDYKNINVSPVEPVPFQHTFMILNEGLDDFTIETTFYYYGKKFLGLWYLGRPYKYYCKALCRDRYFEILESKDER